MNSSKANTYDAIERIIFDTGVRIESVKADRKDDKLFVFLTSKRRLQFRLSAYTGLKSGTETQLHNWTLTSGGLGIHWPELDEDLSLKGFLEEELKVIIGDTSSYAVAA